RPRRQGDRMTPYACRPQRWRRRDVVAVLGGVALARPLAAHAQKMPLLGTLWTLRQDDDEAKERTSALLQALQSTGWENGRNLQMEFRWADGNAQRAQIVARELIGLKPDILLAQGTLSLQAI